MHEFVIDEATWRGEQGEMVREWRHRYDTLTRLMGRFPNSGFGSLVRIYEVIESDMDTSPGNFVRTASLEFIFPRQRLRQGQNNSGIVDPTTNYSIVRTDETHGFDPGQVTGYLQVAYRDARGQIRFSVDDHMQGGSELPELLVPHLETAFDTSEIAVQQRLIA